METLTDQAIGWIARRNPAKPFFLYFNPVAVHEPITPSKGAAGSSAAGPYGDWIHELDRSVGRLLDALDQQRLTKDTLIVFTSDNVVLFNGQGQPEEDFMRGSKFSGRVHSLLDGLGVKYVYADATGAMARYLSRNYRHWLWLEGAILIFDDLLAYEAGRFDRNWRACGAGPADGEKAP